MLGFTTDNILQIPENSCIDYIFEINCNIPKEFHDKLSKFPIAPENIHCKISLFMSSLAEKCNISVSGTNKKLIPNLLPKTKYIVHYRNLQLYLKLGLKITKIHRVIKFT